MYLLLKAFVMGVVEGVTEFLPISSTGHLIIVNEFIRFPEKFAKMFEIVIQSGAILAVVVYFWDRLYPWGRSQDKEHTRQVWLIWRRTLVGVIPALIVGGVWGGEISERLFRPGVVIGALIVGGIVIIAVELMKRRVVVNDVLQISYWMALAVGVFQCLAMIPGTSRSAATIIGAMLLGVSRVAAVEFSFFLAVPTIVAATGYALLKMGLPSSVMEAGALLVGFVVSFLTAWLVIAFFMGYIRKNTFLPFAYYRIALGVIVLVYFFVAS